MAEDGNGGSAKQLLTVNVVKGASSTNSYDSLTLDWERGTTDVNPNWVFGGAMSSAAVHDNAKVLRFTHPKGAEKWAGVALIEAPGGTDLIADRSDSVSMRVWAEADGSVTLAMEDISSIAPNTGATRYLSVTEDVIGGQWNDLIFDFGDPDSAAGDAHRYNKLVLRLMKVIRFMLTRLTPQGYILIAPERSASGAYYSPQEIASS